MRRTVAAKRPSIAPNGPAKAPGTTCSRDGMHHAHRHPGTRKNMTMSLVWIVPVAVLLLVESVRRLVRANAVRFERRVGEEMRALAAVSPSRLPRSALAALPRPVMRYRALAFGDRAPVRTLRIRHSGTFSMSLSGKPRPIRGDQFFTVDPPGFVWSGRVRIAPGAWVDARDMSIVGCGSMRVLLDDTITLVNLNGGAELDEGSALRLLAEMVWVPTALFDERHVTWSPVDDTHAKATLRVGSVVVSGVFEFGQEGLPSRFDAERFHDKGERLPWGGIYRDYRRKSGMLVPFEAEVFWELASGPFTYAHWFVDSMDYDDVLPEAHATPAPIPSHDPLLAR